MKPVERISVIDSVISEIKKLIEEGNFRPGDKLPTEKELCQTLRVGRSTVREAVRMLQAMGYVEMIPGRGAHVASRSYEEVSIRNWFQERGADLSDYIEMRLAIEPYAARLAAQRALDEEKKSLATLVEKYRKTVEEDKDADRLAWYDQEFHKLILGATHNRILTRISEAIFEDFVPVLNKLLSMQNTGKPDPATTIAYHQAIADAISAGDAEKSEQLMRRHLELARNDIERLSVQQ